MRTTVDRLVYMANQIACELETQRGAEAAKATWDHLWHFWDPAMCNAIVDHLAQGGAGLGDTARQAVILLRDRRTPDPQTPATRYPSAGAREDASDAG